MEKKTKSILTVYSYDTGKSETFEARRGALVDGLEWRDRNLADMDEVVKNMIGTYAWAWFVLDYYGKLADYGIERELTVETAKKMAYAVEVEFEDVEEDADPLPASPSSTRK